MKLNKKQTITANALSQIVALITSIIGGMTLSFGWNTFLASTFNLPEVTVPVAIAFILMLEYLKINIPKQYVQEYSAQKMGIDKTEMAFVTSFAGLLITSYVWLLLFILSLFM